MKTDRFSEMGMAALLPGMQYMVDQMQAELDRLKQTLQAFQHYRSEADSGAAPRRGRPPGSKNSAWAGMTAAQRSAEMQRRQGIAAERRAAGLGPTRQPSKGMSWANMNAQERSIEMRRRMAVARERRAQGLKPPTNAEKGRARRALAAPSHPRDPRHPGHAQWLAKISKSNKKRWADMSEADRNKRISRMVRGNKAARAEAQLVNGAA
jgi:hypothetical protein